jgi:Common central domain of tyrosinase/Polyphenol oxidase middle domain
MCLRKKAWNILASIFLTTCLFNSACTLPAEQAASYAGKAPALQVRMRWQDFIAGPAGAKRLASLETAVKKMKSLDNSTNPTDFRRSWRYWANIHGFYGPSSPDGTVAQQVQFLQSNGLGSYASNYQGVVDQTPPDSVAKAIWATCEHSAGPGPKQANFFGWHRMYLYYFERVLRWAANDNTLRLPYWDYTSPTQEKIPAAFRVVTSVMYDAKRDPGMNQGTSQLNSNSTNVDAKLLNANFLSYEYNVETTIHGYVHCTVGPTCPVAHMGDVPLAGNDPVFYEHHANIDRLWACWEKLHPTPAGAWQNQKFSFVDETGTMQTEPVSKFLDSATLGYVYDNVSSCSRTPVRKVTAAAVSPQAAAASGDEKFPVMVATSSKPVSLTQATTSVDITVPATKLHSLAIAPEGSSSSELVLRDVTAQSLPGAMVDIYIAKKEQPANRKFVGTINWFGAFRHHGTTMPYKQTHEFDVTEQLRTLGVTTGTSGVTVTFEATNGRVPTGAAPAAKTNAAAPAFRPEAKLQIGTIEIRQAASAPPAK